VALLDRERPWHVLYRSPEPLLAPQRPKEREGVVDDVVFPTGLDARPDLGPGIVDIYYGMADARIGAARLHAPAEPPLRLHDQHAGHPRSQPAPADAGRRDQPKLLPPKE
jgi:hypothetical protein